MSAKSDDFITKSLSQLGVFRLEAAIGRFHENIPVIGLAFARAHDAIDGLGISNKAAIERYNERHPDAPLPNPYQQINSI